MKFFLLLVFIIPGISFLAAQQKDSIFTNPFSLPKDSINLIGKKDSLYQTAVKQDSISKSAASDTSKKKTYDVDSVIYSSASDSLIFFVNKKKMDIYGNGEVKYKQTDLKSAKIFVDFNTNNIEAIGIPSDSLPSKLQGTPILNEGGEEYTGQRMIYNFKTSRGFIHLQEQKPEEQYIQEQKLKKLIKMIIL